MSLSTALGRAPRAFPSSTRSWRRLGTMIIAGLLVTGCGGSGDGETEGVPVNSLTAVTTTRADGASQQPRDDVDAFVQQQLRSQKMPGATVVVLHDGQIVYAKGYGYGDVAHATPIRLEQRLQIGSISKTFLATAVMMLREEGRIDLDAKIADYLGPEGPAYWSDVTVRQVLAHTAGLAYLPDNDFFAHIDDAGATTEEHMLAAFRKYPVEFQPGSRWMYSNVGYDLLGFIVSRITGKFYGDYVKERIFTPLGMTSARYINPNNSFADKALGYVNTEDRWKSVDLSSGSLEYLSAGASGVEMSALDMAKFDAAVRNGTLLPTAAQTLMWTPEAAVPDMGGGLYANYGLGWFVAYMHSGNLVVSHSGGMDGYTTQYIRYVDSGWSVVVLTNLDYQVADPGLIATGVVHMFSDDL